MADIFDMLLEGDGSQEQKKAKSLFKRGKFKRVTEESKMRDKARDYALSRAESDLYRAESDLAAARKKINDFEEKAKAAEKRTTDLETKVREAERDKARIEERAANAEGKRRRDEQKKLANKQKRIDQLHEEKRRSDQQMQKLQQEKSAAESRIRKLEHQLAQAQKKSATATPKPVVAAPQPAAVAPKPAAVAPKPAAPKPTFASQAGAAAWNKHANPTTTVTTTGGTRKQPPGTQKSLPINTGLPQSLLTPPATPAASTPMHQLLTRIPTTSPSSNVPSQSASADADSKYGKVRYAGNRSRLLTEDEMTKQAFAITKTLPKEASSRWWGMYQKAETNEDRAKILQDLQNEQRAKGNAKARKIKVERARVLPAYSFTRYKSGGVNKLGMRIRQANDAIRELDALPSPEARALARSLRTQLGEWQNNKGRFPRASEIQAGLNMASDYHKRQSVANSMLRYKTGPNQAQYMAHDEAYRYAMGLLFPKKGAKDTLGFDAQTRNEVANRLGQFYVDVTTKGLNKSEFRTEVQNVIKQSVNNTAKAAAARAKLERGRRAQLADAYMTYSILGRERAVNPMRQGSVANVIDDLARVIGRNPALHSYMAGLNRFNERNQVFTETEDNRSFRRAMMRDLAQFNNRVVGAMGERDWFMLAQEAMGNKNYTDAQRYAILERHAAARAAREGRWATQTQLLKASALRIPKSLLMAIWPRGTRTQTTYDPATGEYSATSRRGWRMPFGKEARQELTRNISSIGRTLAEMWSQNPTRILWALFGAVKYLASVILRTSALGFKVGAGATALGVGAAAAYGMSAANRRAKLQNLYNISIPRSWRNGMSYDAFENQSFKDARLMRSNAYLQQENALRLATAVGSARYVTGANAGKPIVTSMDQVSRMNRVMSLMARITGTSDADLAGVMLQIQQGIGKGKLDTQDIKPMENRSPALANLWAKKILGLSGAAEMFRVMEEGRGDRTKGLTPEKFLPRMMSAEVERELIDLMRGSVRTWEEVLRVVGSDLQEGMKPFVVAAQAAGGGNLGSQILGVSQYIAEENLSDTGKLGDIVLKIMPSLEDLPTLLNMGAHTLAQILGLSGQLTKVFSGLIPVIVDFGTAVLSVIGGLYAVVGSFSTVFKNIGKDGPWKASSSLETAWKISDAVDTLQMLKQPVSWQIENLGEGLLGASTEFGKVNFGMKHVENAEGKDVNVEDQGLGTTAANIAKDTGEIKRNGAKLTAIQLELLKQVSGRMIVNRVTRVTPNIVANVGTIKSGVEYDQFMRDLRDNVRIATMNVAY